MLVSIMALPKTYIFDFDSTLVTIESLDELARIVLGRRQDGAEAMAELEAITKLGMTGQLGFDESLRRRLALFAASRDDVAEVIELIKRSISPSVLAHADWLRNNAADIYVISGGFTDYIVPVVDQLGIAADHVFANSFVFDAAGNITGYDETSNLSKPQGKVQQVKSLGLTGRQVIMVGDGYTDYEVKHYGAADKFWAYTETVARPQVVEVADRVVTSFAEVVDQ